MWVEFCFWFHVCGFLGLWGLGERVVFAAYFLRKPTPPPEVSWREGWENTLSLAIPMVEGHKTSLREHGPSPSPPGDATKSAKSLMRFPSDSSQILLS